MHDTSYDQHFYTVFSPRTALLVLQIFAVNAKCMGTCILSRHSSSFISDSEEEPGLFIRLRHSFSHCLLPSFLPNTESQTQQQFKLESDIEIFQSVFYVYTRFLERGKFDIGLFIIAIETENETNRITPENAGCPTVYPGETHRCLCNWPQNNLHSELDADIYISAFHQTTTLRFAYVIPKERLGIWVILQSQNVAFSLYLHILSWHEQMASGGEWRE